MTSAPHQKKPTGQTDTASAPRTAAHEQNSTGVPASLPSAPATSSIRSSYASATKGSVPPNASEPTNMATAVGGPPSADAISPMNGRNPTIPAVPSVGGPTIVNGNSVDHSRKPSFTVTSSGASGFATNGGAVGGGQNKANNIQFGSMNAGGSPALNNPPALASQSTSNLGVASLNPRLTSPQTSPSPIPQPAISGGRPPSSLQGQGNGVSFGQISGESNDANVCSSWSVEISVTNLPLQRSMRPMPQGQMGASQQPIHLRRDSSQSSHGDMSNQGMPSGPGRGGYPMQGGRGRGYGGQFNPQMAYSPQQNFRPPPNGRGMQNMQAGFHPGRQQGPYPGSPSLAARSPAMMNANPATPQMGPVQMMPGMPGQHNGYPPYMGNPQVNRHLSSIDSVLPPKKDSSFRGRGNRGTRASKTRGRGGSNFNNSAIREEGNPGEQRVSRDPASQYYQSPTLGPPAVLAAPLLPPADLSPESGNFEQFLTLKNQGHVQYMADPSIQAMYQQQWMQQQQMQGYMPPQSPRPPYAQNPSAPYMQQSYSGQGQPPHQSQPLSRTPSQMSVSDRPNSSLGQPQTPALVSASGHPPATRTSSSPAPKSAYIVPPKKSSAIVIKNALGEAVTFSKAAHSPARATPSPVKIATPPVAPPASQPLSNTDAIHTRTDSISAKTNEEKKKEMQEAVAKKLAEEAKTKQDKEELDSKAAQDKIDAETKAAEAKDAEEKEAKAREAEAKAAQEAAAEARAAEAKAIEVEQAKAKEAEIKEAEAKAVEAKEAAVAKAKEEADAKEKQEQEKKAQAEADSKSEAAKDVSNAPVPANKAQNDEPDYDAIEAELAAQEAEEEAREAAYQKKKDAARAAQKQKEQEEEAAYEANMKKMEREAEAREEALSKKKAEEGSDSEESKKLFASLKAEDAAQDAPTPDSSSSPVIQTPAESGTATPISDISMPPPVRGKKDRKPTELTLNTTKAVEPPQASAALKSLQSARFLEDPSKIDYPSAIVSPNPALNSNAPAERKFKYNKEFLLQFQPVFKEKPSLDWDARVRETLGDGGESSTSARPSSARTPSGMGGRSVSNRPTAVPGSFGQMGAFGATARAGPAQLPPGTTSAQRFAMSNNTPAPSQRNTMQNPFEAFGRPAGLPMGSGSMGSMSRNGSNAMGGVPPSPRIGGGSTRGGARSGSKRDNKSNRHDAKDDQSMPLTSGMDLKPIAVSQSGWKARSLAGPSLSGPALGGDGLLPPDVVQRKVKSHLNKMTPEKFDKIADQVLEIAAQSKDESDGRTLRQVIQLTFEKATDEAHWASMYAMFCKRMLESMSVDIKDENIKDKHGAVVTGGNLFRKYLLNRCQEEFERGWKTMLPDKPEGQTEEAKMLSDEYYIEAAAKRRGLGLVKFIGELYKLSMLTERIMHECVKKLLDYEGMPDEAEIESLTSLLKTVGRQLDDPGSKNQPLMNVYFSRMDNIMNMPALPSRLRFMLLDVIDLRRKGWNSKEDNKGPKTIQEIREEAQRQQQVAEQQRIASQSNRGGGGRMPMGRGDARGFGYNQQPPPDHSGSRIGSDDLRRLGNRASRNPSNNSGPGSFGPTSLLGGRTNSGPRRNLGPSASLMNQREDSAGSSRTGTPPVKEKEKKDESSTNAFR